jgi:hypothetical protein
MRPTLGRSPRAVVSLRVGIRGSMLVGMDPLIVTAVLADPAQARLDVLRTRHFPPERNHLAAHVTLFHALPGSARQAVAAALAEAVRRPAPAATVGPVRSLGRGVAFRIGSPDVLALRGELARRWDPWLTPQDRGKRELHATVQNTVSVEAARALLAELAAVPPEPTTVVALGLWRYLGGPWEALGRFVFQAGG